MSITRDRNGFLAQKYTNRFRISWKDIFRYQIYTKHETDIRNHYVMPSVRLKRSHNDIYVYLELCKQKRRADDELEFSRVPYTDPKQKRESARDGN